MLFNRLEIEGEQVRGMVAMATQILDLHFCSENKNASMHFVFICIYHMGIFGAWIERANAHLHAYMQSQRGQAASGEKD